MVTISVILIQFFPLLKYVYSFGHTVLSERQNSFLIDLMNLSTYSRSG